MKGTALDSPELPSATHGQVVGSCGPLDQIAVSGNQSFPMQIRWASLLPRGRFLVLLASAGDEIRA
jgi:hypothetical protein